MLIILFHGLSPLAVVSAECNGSFPLSAVTVTPLSTVRLLGCCCVGMECTSRAHHCTGLTPKASSAVPDVASRIEQTLTDPHAKLELSAEAYSRFGRGLGKMLWMAQVRHDVKVYLSLIGSQQAKPLNGTEAALKSLLRYLFGDMQTVLQLPSKQFEEEQGLEISKLYYIHGFCDASFAPYRFNGRRGLTGGALFVEGSLIRSTARQQQSVALSSCESELYALQTVTQEAAGLVALCQRIYVGLGETLPNECANVLMESDSESALQLLFATDIPKKSRHVEIRLNWLRSKMHSGESELKHCAGLENCSDIFTKCLPSKDFWRHRKSLGFIEQEVPLGERSILTSSTAGNGQPMYFVEICCSEKSALREACRVARMPYAGVSANVQDRRLLEEIQCFVETQRGEFRWVHVHCSILLVHLARPLSISLTVRNLAPVT